MLNVIICANFGVEKLRGLGNTRGQILEFPTLQHGWRYRAACDVQDDRQEVRKTSRCATSCSCPGQLSLAIPPWVG